MKTRFTFVEVHMSVDVGEGEEVFVTNDAAVDRPAVIQHLGFTQGVPVQGFVHYRQPEQGETKVQSSAEFWHQLLKQSQN